jgi:Tol biopolymer transport system component
METGYDIKKIIIFISGIFILGIPILVITSKLYAPDIRNFKQTKEYPKIFPDYSNIVLPPNIAPINFEIKEPGNRFIVRLYSKNKTAITLNLKNPVVKISINSWRYLLSDNKGDSIKIDIYAKQEGTWVKFKTINNFVSKDKIDPFIYYRDISPTNSYWDQMAMHQRDLESFKEYEIFNNSRTDHNCMNCHTFWKNDPNKMLFHMRGEHSGTIFYDNGKLTKINLKTSKMLSAGAYCSWHPNGKLVAFATNKIRQNYYLTGYEKKMKEVFDFASDIIIYDVEKNTILSFPKIASKKRENLPCWSPDGKYLYYTCAKEYVIGTPNEEVLYSLMRVSFDADHNTMGEPETIISSEEAKKSIAFPTISPDGKFMLMCMVDFGYFPVNNKSSDLYLMDMSTNRYYKPDINSDESESYISWSSNSKWFVFSSRRLDGVTSKPFICSIDSLGNTSKPFILPQEDPLFYIINHKNFARPELIKNKFNLNFGDLKEVIYSKAIQAKLDSTIYSDSSTLKNVR